MNITIGDLGKQNPGYKLKRSIVIDGEHNAEDNSIILEYRPLGIYTFSEPRDEAIGEVQDEIVDMYEHLLNTPDENLGPLMLQYKKHVRDLVEKEAQCSVQ